MKTKLTIAVLLRAALLLASTLGLQTSTALAAPTVTQIAVSVTHSLFIMSDGSLWGMGDNFLGDLGDGTYVGKNLPEEIVASNVTTVAVGEWHSLFRKSDGSLWAMGNESGYQAYTNYYPNVPTQIVSRQVTCFAAGYGFNLYGQYRAPTAGSLWAMGENSNGQLGDGTTISTNIPQEILSTFNSAAVTAVSCGFGYSHYIRPGGSLWAMGDNAGGQLGDGTTTERDSPVEIEFSNVVAVSAGGGDRFIKSDGSLWATGLIGQIYTSRPEEIVPSNVVAVASDLFIKSDGSLWKFDSTSNDQIVLEEIIASNVVAVAGFSDSFLFIKSDGSLWGMGGNRYGQLGDGTFSDSPIPMQIVPYAIKDGGFELGDFSGWDTSGNFTLCYDTQKPATYIHSGKYGAQLGPVGALGYLSQNFFLTTAGATYLLSFWVNSPDGETPNEFLVSWNGTTLMDETNVPATGWTHLQFQITATGPSGVLQFGFRNDNSYFGLDDISIVRDEKPVITGIKPLGTNLVLSAANGELNGTYFTLMSTNLALPLNQWTPVATNSLSAYGDFTVTATNAVSPDIPQRFYILRLQK